MVVLWVSRVLSGSSETLMSFWIMDCQSIPLATPVTDTGVER